MERSNANPALRLDVTVPDFVGGFGCAPACAWSIGTRTGRRSAPRPRRRVYSAALERTFAGSLPTQVVLGRFYNPAETYSGYWGRVLVRLGGRALGVGAVAGFEPDRWNEVPSTNVPKATVFSEWRLDGTAWDWQGDVSLHAAWPSDSLPEHTFAGLSQRLRTGPLRLSQDLQIDRDLSGAWKPSRISLRASLNLNAALSVRATALRRESYMPWRLDDVFAPQRDRLGVGLGVRARRAYGSFDVNEMRGPEETSQRAYSGFLSVPGPFGFLADGQRIALHRRGRHRHLPGSLGDVRCRQSSSPGRVSRLPFGLPGPRDALPLSGTVPGSAGGAGTARFDPPSIEVRRGPPPGSLQASLVRIF